ncbi:cache domain-containing protein [Salinibacterium sp. G-O1]|uniref:cache domain-containing protein n=1 Tax=Salinibacterium sp. G-O1 TaxID=3046208 RepID=UPI0024B8C780|nr:cache domain-containing protein [Salinibacterium sp. G-O1]MDJ0335586.1 cache domain-containing protein [Salinibacterium sp. G-O1]
MERVDDVAATAMSDVFDSVFALIDDWRAAVGHALVERNGVVTAAEIDHITGQLVVPRLSHHKALIIGGGFVAARGFLADTDWHLAWWLGSGNTFRAEPDNPIPRRLQAEEDPTSDTFRDYTALEWWRVPAATMARHITGPYVDYLCTDEYTLTLTMPVSFRGAMVGVVGADLFVSDVERALLPALRSIGAPATLINASRRIVVSTDPHRPTGTILREHVGTAELACGDTGLLLVVD